MLCQNGFENSFFFYVTFIYLKCRRKPLSADRLTTLHLHWQLAALHLVTRIKSRTKNYRRPHKIHSQIYSGKQYFSLHHPNMPGKVLNLPTFAIVCHVVFIKS